MATRIPEKWSSAISTPSKVNAKLVRETLDELKCDYVRDKEDRHYTRVMVVMPMPQFAYVFKFLVNGPEKFEVHLYDTKPNHSGVLHFIEIRNINSSNIKLIKKFLKKLTKKIGTPPYKFDWYERIRTGIFYLEYIQAKNRWAQMGIR